MFAKEFFSIVEKCVDAECTVVKIKIDGSPEMKLRHCRDGYDYVSIPEELLLFRDLYPLLETYMYARFVSNDVIELLDSNNREQYQLLIQDVSQDGNDVVIVVGFVGTE